MSEGRRVTVVSGASGFLGRALVRHLAAHGHEVRALARSPDAQPVIAGVTWHACTLPDVIAKDAFEGARGLVHCAYDTRFADEARARAVNVEGSRRLFERAREAGVSRVVFVSSLSAHADAVSVYGRTKLEVEALLDPERDAALRPGQIIGEGGVFWRQAEQIARLPFVPLLFGGGQEIQTVALEDVCEALRILAEGRITGVLRYAELEAVTLRTLYAAVARHLGKPARFVRVPGEAALRVLQMAEKLGFGLPLSSDNVLGLKRLRAFDVEADVERIGVRPRTMQESLVGIRWNELARR